jgi:hypothetical protein
VFGSDEGAFTVDEFKDFFDDTLASMEKLIEECIVKAPHIKAIFLVGGFAASKYLQTRISAKVHTHTHTHIYIYIYILHLFIDLSSGMSK